MCRKKSKKKNEKSIILFKCRTFQWYSRAATTKSFCNANENGVIRIIRRKRNACIIENRTRDDGRERRRCWKSTTQLPPRVPPSIRTRSVLNLNRLKKPFGRPSRFPRRAPPPHGLPRRSIIVPRVTRHTKNGARSTTTFIIKCVWSRPRARSRIDGGRRKENGYVIRPRERESTRVVLPRASADVLHA